METVSAVLPALAVTATGCIPIADPFLRPVFLLRHLPCRIPLPKYRSRHLQKYGRDFRRTMQVSVLCENGGILSSLLEKNRRPLLPPRSRSMPWMPHQFCWNCGHPIRAVPQRPLQASTTIGASSLKYLKATAAKVATLPQRRHHRRHPRHRHRRLFNNSNNHQ